MLRKKRELIVAQSTCELCAASGGAVLWSNGNCRVVKVDDPVLPGFWRVIWHAHVGEMTDLPLLARNDLMAVVFALEAAIRECWQPDKINLASFGNVVPHLHWHVIPRWRDDRFFPEPIWGKPQREVIPSRTAPEDGTLLAAFLRHLEQGARS